MERLLSPEEAGEILAVTADTVRRLCKDGRLAHVKLGERSRVRIRPRDLEAFIDARVVPVKDTANPALVRIRERRKNKAS